MVHMAMATAVVGDLMISVVHGVNYHQILNGRGTGLHISVLVLLIE